MSKDSTLPLDTRDREEQEEVILKNGPPTIALGKFIDVVLAEAIGENVTLPTFYQLMENHGLVVYGKVIDGKKISNDKLLNVLRKREQQADDSFDDDSFQFWNTLDKESRYSVYREDVAKAYKNAGKLRFPWLNLADEFVLLDYQIDKPNEVGKQKKWDAIPSVDQKYWKHRDTLNIIEFAFILKGKQPQSETTQLNVKDLYPLDFCKFFAELFTQSDSSWKTGKLTEINPPAPNCEEWTGLPDFERKELINWAVSKEIDVPGWLACEVSTKEKEGVSIFKQQQKQIEERNGKPKVTIKFIPFNNLHANNISLVMMEGKAKMVIRGKAIDIYPEDLGLKVDGQGWKLLEKAAMSGGDLTDALKKINKTSDRDKEKNKVKTSISRLRKTLQDKMGLEGTPIVYSNGSYRFTFETMTHELISGSNVTKGDDAMNHVDSGSFDDDKYGDNDY